MSTPRPAVSLPAHYPQPRTSSSSSYFASSPSSSSPSKYTTSAVSTSMPLNSYTSALSSHLRGVSRNTVKQLKFVLPGGLVTYVLGTLAKLGALLGEESSRWARCVVLYMCSLESNDFDAHSPCRLRISRVTERICDRDCDM